MARVYEHDIKVAVKARLDSDFNTMIDTMRVERSDSTIPYCNNFTIDTLNYNYPETTIDIDGESEQLQEILNDNIDIEPEIYPVKVKAIIQTQVNTINSYADYYNEAFKRVLHGATLTGCTWCRVKTSTQQELLDENMNTFKSCGVNLEVRIN